MIIQCESCSRKFTVNDKDIPARGRTVQCGYCSVTWHQMPISTQSEVLKKSKVNKPLSPVDDSPSVDSIKASDGKTYRFLGSQWAELLPSGKTGLFARKKISKELDEITGRKEIRHVKKKKKKLDEVDPSSESLEKEQELKDIGKSNNGLGLFGYIFLIIIIAFSLIGILKTFEDELINNYPEFYYIFEKLNEQLEYFVETVSNVIVIIKDLTNTY